MSSNMATRILRYGSYEVVLWLHSAEHPDNHVWEQSVAHIKDVVQSWNGDVSNLRGLIISDGGFPSGRQRDQLRRNTWGTKSYPACVITLPLTPLGRGVVTAFSWVNRGFKAFYAHELDAALRHINLDGAWPTLRLVFKEMQDSMGPVEVLANIESYYDKTIIAREQESRTAE